MEGLEAMTLRAEVRERVERFPALGAVVLEVLRLTGNPDCNTGEVGEVLASDAALAARVLRLANSAYYGLPRRVESVSLAVSLLGLRAVRRLTLSVVTYDLMQAELDGYGYREGALWAHSLGASVAAEYLCRKFGYRKEEEVRLMALLHDVGKIVVSPFLVATMNEADAQKFADGGSSGCDRERELCGMDHAQAGAMIAEHWKLSSRFQEVIMYHHEPENAPDYPRASAIVGLADSLARAVMGNEEDALASWVPDGKALQLLQPRENVFVPDMAAVARAIKDEIAYWAHYAAGGAAQQARQGREEGSG